MLGASRQPPSRAKSQLAHLILSGTGKIRFHRGTTSAALRLRTQTLVRWLGITEQSSGLPMAEITGPFSLAARRKLCGPFRSQIQVTERRSAKLARSSEPQMVAFTG